MSPKDRTDAELWQALEALGDDPLDAAVSREVLDGALRNAGVDPQALRTRGAEFVSKLREQHRLAWQDQARRRRDSMRQRTTKVVVPPGTPRSEILGRLDDLRRNPKYGAPIMTAFHKRKPEESSDDDLRMLLEDVEELRALQVGEDDGNGNEDNGNEDK
jgi:hypothetical protein